MNITTGVSAVALDKIICQEDLALVFQIVSEKIKSGELAGYTIVTEKSSDSHILYDVRARQSMKPVAVLANGIVSPLPPTLEPKSPEATDRLLEMDARLRTIASSVCPAFTPA